MNDRNLDTLLDAWLDLGPTWAPARVAEAIRLEVRSTRQTAIRQWWPPRRYPTMNNTAKIALGAAAVIVAAVIGFGILGRIDVGGPNIGSTEPTPDPDEAVVREWVVAVNEQDREALVALMAEHVTFGQPDVPRGEVADYVLDTWCPMTVNEVERVDSSFLMTVDFRDNADGRCTDGAPGTSGSFVLEVTDGKITRVP
jgi:hypothetical protein